MGKLVSAFQSKHSPGGDLQLRNSVTASIAIALVIVTAFVVVLIAAGITSANAWGSLGFFFLPLMLWFVLLMTGLSLITRGLPKRVGESIHCRQCEYPLVPDAESYDACPECGADVSQPGAVRFGTRRARPKMIGAGVVLLLIGGIALLSVMFTPRTVTNRLPTSVLAWCATTDFSLFNPHLWNELTARPLTADERNWLATRVLDQRSRGSVHFAGAQWMEQAVLNGTISTELIDRYFADAYSFYFDAPETVEHGSELRIRLQSTTYAPFWPVIRPHFVLEAARFNGGDCDCLAEKTWPFVNVGRRRHSDWPCPYGECMTALRYDTAHEFFEQREYEIDIAFWVLFLPAQRYWYAIEWNDDGTPALPDGTMWAERFERSVRTRIVAPSGK